jgi:hypothetical protein
LVNIETEQKRTDAFVVIRVEKKRLCTPHGKNDGRNHAHRNITKLIPRKNHDDEPLMANAHPG